MVVTSSVSLSWSDLVLRKCLSGNSQQGFGWKLLERSCLAETLNSCRGEKTWPRLDFGGEHGRECCCNPYPFTLIFENERTAVPGRGLPMSVAGRNVVKINMFFNECGRSLI